MSKRALLVGIDKYVTRPEGKLRGCKNDVVNIRDILLRIFGFKAEDIRVITDDRATKAAIMERLRWLITTASAGDSLLFHFSGHGSQIRDRHSDELSDGLDELLCSTDINFDTTYILDDDLAAVFSLLPEGVSLDVSLDNCHAGSATRGGLFSLPEINAPVSTARFLAPPLDIQLRVDETLTLPVTKLALPRENNMDSMRHCLFAGCTDAQTAADACIRGSYSGAMSYVLCEVLRATQGKLTRAEPVSALDEQGRLHHLGVFAELETELTTWTQDAKWSPNRLDALVWGVTDLGLIGDQGAAFLTGAAAVEAMAMEAGVVAAAGMFVLGGAALASSRMMAKKAKSKATAAQQAKAAAAPQEDEILALVSVEEVTPPAARAATKTKKAAKKAKKQVDATAAAAPAVLSSSSAA